jgi:acyl carrier protein
VPESVSEAHERSRRLEHIAAELSDAAAILAGFEAWHRGCSRAAPAGHVSPGSDVERRLAGLWAEVLGVARVGARDLFFELDGDSLKMVQVVVRVLEIFGVELPIEAFFENPTVEAHAARIIELQQTGSASHSRAAGGS